MATASPTNWSAAPVARDLPDGLDAAPSTPAVLPPGSDMADDDRWPLEGCSVNPEARSEDTAALGEPVASLHGKGKVREWLTVQLGRQPRTLLELPIDILRLIVKEVRATLLYSLSLPFWLPFSPSPLFSFSPSPLFSFSFLFFPRSDRMLTAVDQDHAHKRPNLGGPRQLDAIRTSHTTYIRPIRHRLARLDCHVHGRKERRRPNLRSLHPQYGEPIRPDGLPHAQASTIWRWIWVLYGM